MLHQSQPIYPCSGCLRCSDGCRRRCRGRSSEHAIDVRHLRTGHNYVLLNNPGTHHNPMSAGIAWERVVMACSLMPDVDRSKWHFSTIIIYCTNDSCNTPLALAEPVGTVVSISDARGPGRRSRSRLAAGGSVRVGVRSSQKRNSGFIVYGEWA